MNLTKCVRVAAAWTVAVFLLSACGEATPEDFDGKLKAIMEEVDAKFEGLPEGTLADVSEQLAALDALAVAEAPTSPENAATALGRKVTVQLFYLEDTATATTTLRDLVARFPGTAAATKGERMLASLRIQAGLVPGAWFPDFEATDLAGDPLTISQFKGRILLVDFWATWCPPCREELPNVIAAYEEFHEAGFEVVGISLDRDRTKLERFIEQKNMPWPQTFDGKAWEGALVDKYGVLSIPTTYLLDRDGRIVASGLRGEALTEKIRELLAAR